MLRISSLWSLVYLNDQLFFRRMLAQLKRQANVRCINLPHRWDKSTRGIGQIVKELRYGVRTFQGRIYDFHLHQTHNVNLWKKHPCRAHIKCYFCNLVRAYAKLASCIHASGIMTARRAHETKITLLLHSVNCTNMTIFSQFYDIFSLHTCPVLWNRMRQADAACDSLLTGDTKVNFSNMATMLLDRRWNQSNVATKTVYVLCHGTSSPQQSL